MLEGGIKRNKVTPFKGTYSKEMMSYFSGASEQQLVFKKPKAEVKK